MVQNIHNDTFYILVILVHAYQFQVLKNIIISDATPFFSSDLASNVQSTACILAAAKSKTMTFFPPKVYKGLAHLCKSVCCNSSWSAVENELRLIFLQHSKYHFEIKAFLKTGLSSTSSQDALSGHNTTISSWEEEPEPSIRVTGLFSGNTLEVLRGCIKFLEGGQLWMRCWGGGSFEQNKIVHKSLTEVSDFGNIPADGKISSFWSF